MREFKGFKDDLFYSANNFFCLFKSFLHTEIKTAMKIINLNFWRTIRLYSVATPYNTNSPKLSCNPRHVHFRKNKLVLYSFSLIKVIDKILKHFPLSLSIYNLLEIQDASRPSFISFRNLGVLLVLTFIGYKRTDKQTGRQAKYIYILEIHGASRPSF